MSNKQNQINKVWLFRGCYRCGSRGPGHSSVSCTWCHHLHRTGLLALRMRAKAPWKLASRVEKATDARQCVAGSDSVHGVPELAEHGAAEVTPTLQWRPKDRRNTRCGWYSLRKATGIEQSQRQGNPTGSIHNRAQRSGFLSFLESRCRQSSRCRTESSRFDLLGFCHSLVLFYLLCSILAYWTGMFYATVDSFCARRICLLIVP